MEIERSLLESVNKPGRIGVLATVDSSGAPNAAYFGSPQLQLDGTFIVALGDNRTLANLKQNPKAVFMAIESAPVDMKTTGNRLYLNLKEIQTEGPALDGFRQAIAARVGPEAAKMIVAVAVFDVTDVRALVDYNG